MKKMTNITLREWVKNYKEGKYKSTDVKVQIEAGWYDWFCSDGSLARRLQKFGSIAKRIENDYILDNYRVWFKNNCPFVGPLYDDMRFEPLDESLRDAKYFLIAIDDERNPYKYCVYTARNNYDLEYGTNDKNELIGWLDELVL